VTGPAVPGTGAPTIALVQPITGVVQHYAWGDPDFIPRLLGATPDGRPWAELWLGTHPNGAARLADGRPLRDVTGDLPYLLKVLAAEAPLSLQAHPDADRARERFAAGDLNYVDAHHKPELLVALTPFEALCGFRDTDRSAAAFLALGLGEVADHLGRGDLRAATELLLTSPGAGAVSSGPVGGRFDADLALVRRLAEGYPDDPGVLVALLLNPVSLGPGEAVWMPAGNLHAYLSGVGVEVMAASDNVLRGGLTRKRVDVAELLRVLRFEVLAEPVVKPVPVAPGVVTWPAPVDEFALHRVHLGGRGDRAGEAEGVRGLDGVDRVVLDPPGPRVVLCTAGTVTALDGAGRPVALTPGQAAIGRAGAGPVTLTGDGEAFVASLGA
jgi:mannose-6-phosphate isomerase